MQLSVGEGLPYQTKQQFVYRVLRDAILRCELKPGQRLVLDAVAKQLGVSPIPVREAFQMLQTEGWVEITPHTGSIVAPISRQSVVETFTVLEGMEIVGTRTAAERVSTEQLARLREQLEEMDTVLQDGHQERWSALNTQFHLTIAQITELPMVLEVTRRAFERWERVSRYFFQGVLMHRLDQSQEQHRQLVRAIAERAFDELEQLAKIHNQSALQSYLSYIDSATKG